MGKFSRDKGARNERSFYHELGRLLPQYVDRFSRNHDQSANGGCDSRTGTPESPGMEPFGVEIKCRKFESEFTQRQVDEWWLEAARKAKHLIPVLAYKANRKRWNICVPEWSAFDCETSDKVTISIGCFARILEKRWHTEKQAPKLRSVK